MEDLDLENNHQACQREDDISFHFRTKVVEELSDEFES
jgi:hypothetical protein